MANHCKPWQQQPLQQQTTFTVISIAGSQAVKAHSSNSNNNNNNNNNGLSKGQMTTHSGHDHPWADFSTAHFADNNRWKMNLRKKKWAMTLISMTVMTMMTIFARIDERWSVE
jgi:hypothetical protein